MTRSTLATAPNDTDILSAVAIHPICNTLRFERVYQDRRLYYRLVSDGFRSGSLTDVTHARQTIEYWRSKGWIAAPSTTLP